MLSDQELEQAIREVCDLCVTLSSEGSHLWSMADDVRSALYALKFAREVAEGEY